MIDNYRKKHNNSASLGRTLARTTQQHNFSYFAQPKEFDIDLQSIKEPKKSNNKMIKKQLLSTPKISPQKSIPSNPSIVQSFMKIQINKQKCSKLGLDVHTATIDKNLRINKMYQQLHHFSICVDELRWLLKQGHSLIEAYLSQAKLIAPTSMHTIDVTNISQEFRSLQLKFANIQKQKLRNIEQYLNKDRNQKRQFQTYDQFYYQQSRDMERNQMRNYPQTTYITSSKQRGINSENRIPFQVSNNYSLPMKQNMNTSNIPNFDNIIVKSQQSKIKVSTNKKELLNTMQSIRQKDQTLQRQREQNTKKLRIQQKRNQQLMTKNQMLKEQIVSLQTKLAKYKVASSKSIEQLSHILRQLTSTQTQKDKDFSLLKLAQSIKNWQNMIDDEAQQRKYRQIYGDPQIIQMQKARHLQQIIELQYEISNLLGQQHNLQSIQNNKASQILEQDLYRILAMQACSLEQLYKC